MKDFIAQRKQRISDMTLGGMYSNDYIQAMKKVFAAEIVAENMRRTAEAKAN